MNDDIDKVMSYIQDLLTLVEYVGKKVDGLEKRIIRLEAQQIRFEG